MELFPQRRVARKQILHAARSQRAYTKLRVGVGFRVYVWHRFQFGQPRGCFAVAGSTIIAARRKRSSGPDLRRIRDAASLELAQFEEPNQERPKMCLDFGKTVLMTLVLG